MSSEQVRKVYVLTWKPNCEDDGSAHINNTFLFQTESTAVEGAREHFRNRINMMLFSLLSDPKDLIQIEILLFIVEKIKSIDFSLEKLSSVEQINNIISEFIETMEKLVSDPRIADSDEEQQLRYCIRHTVDNIRFYDNNFEFSFPGVYTITEKTIDSIPLIFRGNENSYSEIINTLTKQRRNQNVK